MLVKRDSLALAVSLFAVCSVSANSKPAPTEGTIVSEKSVDCGSQKKGHKKSLDLLCQEYVIRLARRGAR